MNIFLSYSSDRRDTAEQVSLALTASGHKVFFDRDSLPAGDEYHARIRKGVENSEAFVFLISPKAVAAGSYALTELKYARQKWPDPRRRVLPVMIERTEYQQIPNYLKAVTVLEPEGNAPAEVVAELERWKANAPGVFDSKGGSVPRQEEVGRGKTVSGSPGGGQLGRRVCRWHRRCVWCGHAVDERCRRGRWGHQRRRNPDWSHRPRFGVWPLASQQVVM
jgi:hypothetical protein